MGRSEFTVSRQLDVTSERCPMTWVRTKLALEAIGAGEILEVTLGDGEMLRNVPRNAEDDGHLVSGPEPLGGGRHRLFVTKRGAP